VKESLLGHGERYVRLYVRRLWNKALKHIDLETLVMS
jgi:hypothetical protein